jgi:hypothetical protein
MPCRGMSVPEVLSSLGDGLAVEADYDTAKLLIAVGDVEVDLEVLLAICHTKLCSCRE